MLFLYIIGSLYKNRKFLNWLRSQKVFYSDSIKKKTLGIILIMKSVLNWILIYVK